MAARGKGNRPKINTIFQHTPRAQAMDLKCDNANGPTIDLAMTRHDKLFEF